MGEHRRRKELFWGRGRGVQLEVRRKGSDDGFACKGMVSNISVLMWSG